MNKSYFILKLALISICTQQSDSIENLLKHFENTNLSQKFSGLQFAKVAVQKVACKVATFLNRDSIGGVFKKVIGYIYQQVVSECVKVSATQAASEKVTDTVGTFLNGHTEPILCLFPTLPPKIPKNFNIFTA